MRRTRRRDGGQMHVVETVLIGLVMVAAVSFVVTFSSPTSVTQPTRTRLANQAGDALAVLDEYPLPDARYGNNTLSKVVIECLQARCDNLTHRLDGLLPEATSYNVHIHNGYAYLPVYEPHHPAGESVNVRYPLEPRLTYVWMQTATEEVAPSLRTTLGVFALPVYNSNILLDGGAGLEVRVQGYNWLNQRSFNLTAYYSTQQAPASGALAAPSILVYKDEAGAQPGLAVSRLANPANASVWMEVRETSGNKIRAGTTLNITAPRGFTLALWQGGKDVEWWNPAQLSGSSVGGMSLTTSLKKDLPGNSAVRLRFNATPVVAPPAGPDAYDFYNFNVRLGNGAYSVADFVMKYRNSPVATGGDFHAVLASVPKPMGGTGTARYAVAVQSPVLPNAAENITITRIEIVQPEGLKIFQGTPTVAGGSSAHGGRWLVGDGSGAAADRLIWAGPKGLLPGEMIDFVVDVAGAGTLTPAVPREHQTAAIRTPTSSTVFTREVGPGLFYGEIARDERVAGGSLTGYYWPPVAGQADIGLFSDVRPVSARSTVLPGTWNYDVATLATLRDSLSLINITLSQRVVPIGDKVVIDVDAQNLLLNLSERGIQAKTTISLYPPWALDSHVKIKTGETEEKSIFDTATERLVLHDFTGDGVKDVLVATSDGGLYVLNGKNGYKVPGMSAKLASGSGKPSFLAVEFLDVADAAKLKPFIVLGTEPSGSGVNLYVLDEDFVTVWSQRVSLAGAGSQKILSVAMVPDIDGNDQRHDLAAGDAAGAWFFLKGGDGTILQSGTPIGVPPASGALLQPGKWGAAKTDGVVTTTGLNVRNSGTVSFKESTLPGTVVDAAKQVTLEFNDGGLMAMDRHMTPIWNYASQLDAYKVYDLDASGVTDVVAGGADGTVVALNGTQAALDYGGIVFASGQRIADAASIPGNPYPYWTVSNDGYLMFTTDAFTTRVYATDEVGSFVGGVPISVPGARAIHMANANSGFVVGDGGKVWRTINGQDESTPAKFSSMTISVPPRTDRAAWNLKDVWAVTASTAYIAGHCGVGCDAAPAGPVFFRTTDSGTTWLQVGAGTIPAATGINRLQFVDASTGFAVTNTGVVYRTLDGGLTWAQFGVPTGIANLRGLWFTSATTGWVVGDGGAMRRTTDGGLTWPATTLGTSEHLNDIAFADAESGMVVGDKGVLFRTHDGGATWIQLPGNAAIDHTRVNFPIPDHAYLAGGSGSGRFVGLVATYATRSVAFTATTLTLPEPANWVTLQPATRNLEGYTDVNFFLSTDNGLTWMPFKKTNDPRPEVLGNVPYHPMDVRSAMGPRTSFKIMMEMVSDSLFPYASPEVEGLTLLVAYGAENTSAPLNAAYMASGQLDSGSTAVYDAQAGGVRSPRIGTFWNQKVGSGVLSLDVGRKLVTASHNDAWVDVLAGTAGAGLDTGRVVALSGANGAKLWESAQLGGKVVAVAFADLPKLTADADVDVVAVVQKGADPRCPGATATAEVVFLNGRTGQRLPSEATPSVYRLCSPWKGFAVADLHGPADGNTDVVVGQIGSAASSAGYINAVNGKDASKMWRTVPSIKGLYTVEWEAPRNAIFGPYIVEVEVSGTQKVGGQPVSLVTRAVNYFLVTPPDRQMPVSPIYTVELVTWYDDWDFAPGASQVNPLPPLPYNPAWSLKFHNRFAEAEIQ